MVALPSFGCVVCNQIGDPGIAFPPALVRAAEAVDDGSQTGRMGLVGDVVYLVRSRAERSQEVPLAFHSIRQDASDANANHLVAAGFVTSLSRSRIISLVP